MSSNQEEQKHEERKVVRRWNRNRNSRNLTPYVQYASCFASTALVLRVSSSSAAMDMMLNQSAND